MPTPCACIALTNSVGERRRWLRPHVPSLQRPPYYLIDPGRRRQSRHFPWACQQAHVDWQHACLPRASNRRHSDSPERTLACMQTPHRQGDLLLVRQTSQPEAELTTLKRAVMVAGKATGPAHRLLSWTLLEAPDDSQAKEGTAMERATIHLTRTPAFSDRSRAYQIYLDGALVGQIHHRERCSFEVHPGRHELFLTIDWCSSPPSGLRLPQARTSS
jgi:hypothetical protein